jgi:hypothetical protein
LKRVLTAFSPTFPGFYLYYPNRQHQSTKMQALIDYVGPSVAISCPGSRHSRPTGDALICLVPAQLNSTASPAPPSHVDDRLLLQERAARPPRPALPPRLVRRRVQPRVLVIRIARAPTASRHVTCEPEGRRTAETFSHSLGRGRLLANSFAAGSCWRRASAVSVVTRGSQPLKPRGPANPSSTQLPHCECARS